jgi:hypothetical protein
VSGIADAALGSLSMPRDEASSQFLILDFNEDDFFGCKMCGIQWLGSSTGDIYLGVQWLGSSAGDIYLGVQNSFDCSLRKKPEIVN